MQKYLSKYADLIYEYSNHKKDIILQGILLWNSIYHTVHQFQENYHDWHFKKHEVLSMDPIREFKELFNCLNVDFTEEIENYILSLTGTHNPTEQKPGSELYRNSQKNIHNWVNRLSKDQIHIIRKGTEEIASLFYSDEEWEIDSIKNG
jgi:hypothetical protein